MAECQTRTRRYNGLQNIYFSAVNSETAFKPATGEASAGGGLHVLAAGLIQADGTGQLLGGLTGGRSFKLLQHRPKLPHYSINGGGRASLVVRLSDCQQKVRALQTDYDVISSRSRNGPRNKEFGG